MINSNIYNNIMDFLKTAIYPFLSALVSAFFYCIAVLVLFGGAGIWVPLVAEKTVGIDAITTFVMATLAPVGADLLLEPKEKKYSILWLTFFIFLFTADAVLAAAAYLRENKSHDWELGYIAVAGTLLTWMIVTLKSGRFWPVSTTSIAGSFGGKTISTNQLTGSGLP